MSRMETVYAIHTFETTNADEISFQYGEPIIVLEKDDEYEDGWWEGQNIRGQVGLFPKNYTSSVNPSENLNNDGPGPVPSSYNNFNGLAMLDSDLNIIPSEYSASSPPVNETIGDMQDQLNRMVLKNQEKSQNNIHSRNTSISGVNNSGKTFKSSSSVSSASSYLSSSKNDYAIHHKFENTVDPRQYAGSPLPSFTNSSNNTNVDTNSSNPLTWNVDQVCAWLHKNGFESVINNFVENDITGDILLYLTAENLKELNIPSFGKRVHILNAIVTLKAQCGIDNDKKTTTPENFKENISNDKSKNDNINNNKDKSTRDYKRDSSTDPSISTINNSTADPKSSSEPNQTSTTNTKDSSSLIHKSNSQKSKNDKNGEGSETSSTQRPLTKKSSKLFSKFNPLRASRADKFQQHPLNGKISKNKDKSRINSSGGWDFLTEQEKMIMKGNNKSEISETLQNQQQTASDPGKGKAMKLFQSRKSRKTAILDRSSLVGSQLGLPRYIINDESIDIINEESKPYYEYSVDKIEEEESLGSIETPDYKGLLKVQGDKSRSWKLRECILKGTDFYYMASSKGLRALKVKGHINLTGYRVVTDPDLLQGNYGFKLVHDTERQYCFAHDDRDKFKGWLTAMMKATIARDIKVPVVSSSNIATIPLAEARKLTNRPQSPPTLPQQQYSTTDSEKMTTINETTESMLPFLNPPLENNSMTNDLGQQIQRRQQQMQRQFNYNNPTSSRSLSPLPSSSFKDGDISLNKHQYLL